MRKLFAPDISRRGLLRATAATGALAMSARWTPARATDENVLDHLSWPGNADPYLVAEFEQANNCQIRI